MFGGLVWTVTSSPVHAIVTLVKPMARHCHSLYWPCGQSRPLASAPYKPASNGQAERAVQIIKNGLSRVKEGSIQSGLARVLLNYRTRPHQTTGRSPAKLLMGRELTTWLSLVHPNITVQVENMWKRQRTG